MSQPEQPFFECDETFVTFRWPSWAVSGTGESKITVSCELEHGSYEVSFIVEDCTDGDRKEVEWWKGERAKMDILTCYPLDSLILIDNLLNAIDEVRKERDKARSEAAMERLARLDEELGFND